MRSMLPLLVLLPLVMLLVVYAVTRYLASRRLTWLQNQGRLADGSARSAQITPAILDQGLKNALICMVAIIVVVGLGSYAVASLSHRSLVQSAGIVGAVGYVLVMAVFFGLWLQGRATRGKVILDCGPHPTRWLFLMLAVLVPLMSLTTMLSSTSGRSTWAFGGPGLMLLQSPFMAVLGLGRLQVTERGLWQFWGLLPWEKIRSVSWTPESTLLIQAKGRFASLSKGALPVPPAHRAAIIELLAQHGVTTAA